MGGIICGKENWKEEIMKIIIVLVVMAFVIGCEKKEPEVTAPEKKVQSTLVETEGNMELKQAVVQKVKEQPESANIGGGSGTAEEFLAYTQQPPTPSPVLSLEDFFEGNTELSSIGCNLLEHPGIETFYSVLKDIRSRDDVQDVLIEISEIDVKYSDWIFSESLYVLTSANKDEVHEWLKPLQPDETYEGWSGGKPSAAPEPKEGMKVIGAWWD